MTTVMCTTSFTPPPLAKILNSVRASNLAWLPPTVHSNCSEAVCLAARTRSVEIFIKYREVSTRMILPNFIDFSTETVLYSRFGGHKGGVVTGRRGRRGGVRLQFGSPGQPTIKVLARSHNRSLQLQARLDARTEFKILV